MRSHGVLYDAIRRHEIRCHKVRCKNVDKAQKGAPQSTQAPAMGAFGAAKGERSGLDPSLQRRRSAIGKQKLE